MSRDNEARLGVETEASGQVSGFRDVDASGKADSLIDYLDQATQVSLEYKRRTYELINAHGGAVLLEAGCGTGDDARALAQLVGSTGKVIGIDSSEAMIAEARRRSVDLDLPLEFRVGDVQALDFPEHTFDTCRIDRVLMHIADPAQAIRELARVTKPGGLVLAYDIDWDSLVIDAPDREVTRAIRAHYCDTAIRNAWIGRQLPRLMREAGLVDVHVEPYAELITDATIGIGIWVQGEAAESAARAGVITPDQAQAWVASLRDAGDRQQFFLCDLAFIVSGTKP